MADGYIEELLHIQTEDGLALAGAAIRPAEAAKPLAIVWIHGNTGSFHDAPYILVGRELARQGYTFVTGNTRGYGVTSEIWNIPGDEPVAGGSAWELLEEAPYDVGAWVDAAITGGQPASCWSGIARARPRSHCTAPNGRIRACMDWYWHRPICMVIGHLSSWQRQNDWLPTVREPSYYLR
jgi:hypothetical protein